ncbi:MAG TPA: hypothetical protein VJ724_16070, partial [Tahibacter sp.]|nr:hypothetical protein [Tahibacter sp.]
MYRQRVQRFGDDLRHDAGDADQQAPRVRMRKPGIHRRSSVQRRRRRVSRRRQPRGCVANLQHECTTRAMPKWKREDCTMADGSPGGDFHWWRCAIQLRNEVWSEAVRAGPLVVVRAMMHESQPEASGLDPVFRIARPVDISRPVARHETLQIEFVAAGAAREPVQAWFERLVAALDRHDGNFRLVGAEAPVRHDASAFEPPADLGDEVCLHFDTPFAFDDFAQTGVLDFARFRALLARRLTRAFAGRRFELPRNDLVALSQYWRIERDVRHVSRSNGAAFALTGRRGPYYLR